MPIPKSDSDAISKHFRRDTHASQIKTLLKPWQLRPLSQKPEPPSILPWMYFERLKGLVVLAHPGYEASLGRRFVAYGKRMRYKELKE